MTTLRVVDLLGGAVRVGGIVELEPTDRGTVVHRMPSWARTQHNDVALSLIETMPSGGRLEVVTDATAIEVDVQLTLLQVTPEPGPPAVFELIVDGRTVAVHESRDGTLITVERTTGAIDFSPGGPTTVRFDGLPAGEKHVELWLPHAAAVHLIELRTDGAVAPPTTTARRWVHYGSSISHCMEAVRPTGVWPVVAARLAGVDLQSFGFAGQCQLDPFAARMITQQSADLISIKAGINILNVDSMRERTFVPLLHGFLDTIREHQPDTPILLVTPIIYPAGEAHPGPSVPGPDGAVGVVRRPPDLALGALRLQRIRELEVEIVTARQAAGDSALHLLSGLELFGPDDVADLHDGLHPNAAGYQRIGERFHHLAFERGPFGA